MAGLGKLLSGLRSRFTTAQSRHLKNSQHIHVANPWHAVGIVTQRPGMSGLRHLQGRSIFGQRSAATAAEGLSGPQRLRYRLQALSLIGVPDRGAPPSVEPCNR